MSRGAFSTLCAAALVAGLAFRLAGLDARPMHHDEANQAVKFGALLEEGHYRYDRNDHHGPTLYYLTLPAAWLRGQTRLADLDERTLRLVPAAFGAGLILLFLSFARHLGRGAVAAAAVLAAVSPALTYYSRFYIQESLFVFFTVAFLVALGRYAGRPAGGRAALAGIFAGLAYATKETSVIVVAAGVAACAAACAWDGRARGGAYRLSHLGAGLGSALAVSFLFYSSFLANPAGFVESVLAFGVYFQRGVDASRHAHPWDYYLRTLGWTASGGLVWTEAFILALAAAGTVWALATGRHLFWPRYVALYSWLAAVIFSLLRYKTPWNVLPFHAGFVLMAGVGVSVIAGWQAGRSGNPEGLPYGRREGAEDPGRGSSGPEASRHSARDGTEDAGRGASLPVGQGFSLAGRGFSLAARGFSLRAGAALLALALGATHLGMQAWRANFRYPADPRNPYVYAHTSTDFLRLVERVRSLAAVHPQRSGMLVQVFAGPYEQWPLPWYLRAMPRVGYWVHAADAPGIEGPVVISSQENAAAVQASLGDRYVAEFYGLRPGALLTVFIERELWDRFLASRASR